LHSDGQITALNDVNMNKYA